MNTMWRRTALARLVLGMLAGASLIPTASCTDEPPPVATVSLGLNRPSAPLGAPVEMHVRFDVAPGIAPLEEDYRVLLHVLDTENELLWTEDHDPPVPTSEWQPGQTVEYVHRVKLPMYPYIGDARLAIGLYSPPSGVRLPLAGQDLGQRSYHVATLRLDPQPESSFLVFEDGWHQAEFDRDGRSDWRWTTERAVLSVRNPHGAARLTLEFDGRPDVFDEPQHLSIVIGDRTIHEAVIDTGDMIQLEEEIAADELGTGDVVRLEIRVDRTFTPSAAGSGDSRELGIRVFYAYFEPLPR